ncbi:hypothetical protein [Aureimonas sp. AU20]|uniref:hypothetical protein n=1 Tax=Aureimonas sp. AU20 TaxID=1349819 RepID=UPI000A8440E9|nr:hypothetical protein [Aureimonas sp. AU20]
MQNQNANSTLGQIINWYLDCAADGQHSSSGIPKTDNYLRTHRSLVDHHIEGATRRRRFVDIDVPQMQALIDQAAGANADSAAKGLHGFFTDLDKFAVFKGLLEKTRTKKLLSPQVTRKARVLSVDELAYAWEALLRNRSAGGLPTRLSCLAVLISTMTLQPLSNVLKLRKDWLKEGLNSWIEPDVPHHVYVPSQGVPFIQSAIEIGELVHQEPKTDFVFPSVGPRSSSDLSFSISQVHDVCGLVLDRGKIKAQDLLVTGAEGLRAQGGDNFSTLIDRIMAFCHDAPEGTQIAIVNAWADRLENLRKNASAARWR